MAKKLFIFDVDGVLLDLWGTMKGVYEDFFSQKLSQREWDQVICDYLRNPEPYALFGQHFDNSDALTRLLPVNGMPELVCNLQKLGFDLAIITSISDREDIKNKRRLNLEQIYGNVFVKMFCTGRGASKSMALIDAVQGYDITFFCDDHPKNAELGKGIITYPLWMSNKHHKPIWKKIDQTGIYEVKSADEILQFVKART